MRQIGNEGKRSVRCCISMRENAQMKEGDLKKRDEKEEGEKRETRHHCE